MSLISVVIPCFNSEKTIRNCLESLITNLKFSNYEIILVDDASTDSTVSIGNEFENVKVIRSEFNQGVSEARNIGLRHGQGEYILFIDSDIYLKSPIGDELLDHLSDKVVALTGKLDCQHVHPSFFGDYKNLYMDYQFSLQENPVAFLYGSFTFFVKSEVAQWDNEIHIGEDTEFAKRIIKSGREISLIKEISLYHDKPYSLEGLLKNDFLVPFWFARSYIKHFLGSNQKKFSHVSYEQLGAISVVGLFFLMIITKQYLWLFLLLVPWGFVNRNFFNFLVERRGQENLHFWVVLTLVDQMVMGFGIAVGLTYFGIKELLNQQNDQDDS